MVKIVATQPNCPTRTGLVTDISEQLARQDVELIAEIFSTPITGAYCWNYLEADKKLAKLYRLGKERNWDAQLDIVWDRALIRDHSPLLDGVENPFRDWPAYAAMPEQRQHALLWHMYSWRLSQFLHGEQGALLVASQLVSCAPSYQAKLYAASQTFDEARHVEAFSSYLDRRVGFTYPINRHLKALLDKILTDPRWDLKFIGMQLIIESLALAAFHQLRATCRDAVLRDILDLITRDESRHVAFGIAYMEELVSSLSASEREERARFAFETCCVMRARIIPSDVFAHFGLDVEEGRRRYVGAQAGETFVQLLFGRLMPGLARVGLITDNVRPLYEELGLLDYAALPTSATIDWADLERELPLAPLVESPV